MNEEQADKMLTPSIIEAAFQAAEAYPELRIVCPWCWKSFDGDLFGVHAAGHQETL